MRGLRLHIDKYTCQGCGAKENLQVHHVDGDATNNVIRNLLTLCGAVTERGTCHWRAQRNLTKMSTH